MINIEDVKNKLTLKKKVLEFFNKRCSQEDLERISQISNISEADLIYFQIGQIELDFASLKILYKCILKYEISKSKTNEVVAE